MKIINIRYFALLREEAGVEQEKLCLSCKTYGEVYEFLKDRHKFSLPVEMIQVAVNDEFSHLHHEVVEGSSIVFIPPVAGG